MAFRRTEGDRSLTVWLSGDRGHLGRSIGSLPSGSFDNDTDTLVDEAMKAALAAEVRATSPLPSMRRFSVSSMGGDAGRRLLELAIGQAVPKPRPQSSCPQRDADRARRAGDAE